MWVRRRKQGLAWFTWELRLVAKGSPFYKWDKDIKIKGTNWMKAENLE